MQKFRCSRTKSEAIVCNVFAPHAMKSVRSELEAARYVCISTDASNRRATKIFPLLVRYFVPMEGVKVKLIELSDEKGETSDIIVALVKKTLKEFGLEDKLIAFCGDNAPVNFGRIDRASEGNVFAKLKQMKGNILGVGCAAHIVHNALRNACGTLDIEIESVVVQIYTHFYIHTIRTEALKSICETSEEEYEQLAGYCKTRFIALRNSIAKIIKMFGPLKQYFDGLRRPLTKSKSIRDFFANPYSKLWFIFIRDQVIKPKSCKKHQLSSNSSLLFLIRRKYLKKSY